MTATTLEERILRLEDIEAIRDLTARYADAVNKGWNGKTVDADAIPDIFAADARREGFDGEVAHGAKAIAAELPKATSVVQLSMYTFLNPVITVDGDTATGACAGWSWPGAGTVAVAAAVYGFLGRDEDMRELHAERGGLDDDGRVTRAEGGATAEAVRTPPARQSYAVGLIRDGHHACDRDTVLGDGDGDGLTLGRCFEDLGRLLTELPGRGLHAVHVATSVSPSPPVRKTSLCCRRRGYAA